MASLRGVHDEAGKEGASVIDILVRFVSIICNRDPFRTHLVMRWIGFDDPGTWLKIMDHSFTRTEQ